MSTTASLFKRLLYSVVVPSGIIVVSVYIFNSYGNFSFLSASIMAFVVGYYAIYLIFKYWIDIDVKRETPQQQQIRYLIVFFVNIALNTEIVYVLITYAYVPLIAAQTIAAVIIAYESFYAYRSFVFYANQRSMAENTVATAKIIADKPPEMA
jgi:hypothetical protein